MLTTPLRSDNRHDDTLHCPPANSGPQCPLQSNHKSQRYVASISHSITILILHAAVVDEAHLEQTVVASMEKRVDEEPNAPRIWLAEKRVDEDPDAPRIWSAEKRVDEEPDTPRIWLVEPRADEEPVAAVRSKQVKRANYPTT